MWTPHALPCNQSDSVMQHPKWAKHHAGLVLDWVSESSPCQHWMLTLSQGLPGPEDADSGGSLSITSTISGCLANVSKTTAWITQKIVTDITRSYLAKF